MSRRVMVFAPHPDDETLGCGGTLLKHRQSGDSIYWVIITNINDEKIWSHEQISERQNEIVLVATAYGFKDVVNMNYDTTKLDELPLGELTKNISAVIRNVQPEVIYVHNRSDIHSDHKVAFNAIMSASKNFNHPCIKNILMYETVSETEFSPALQENAFMPNYFVNITGFLEKKLELMKIYRSEIKDHPFPRSEKNIKALATIRGAQCGVEYAEAFMILRWIWK